MAIIRRKIAVSVRHWYLLLCMGGVWSAGWIESNQQTRRHPYIVTTLFGYILYCGYFNLYCVCFKLFCNVWVCVCVGFVMCGCVYVWVL